MIFSKRIISLLAFLIFTYQINNAASHRGGRRDDEMREPPCKNQQSFYPSMYDYDLQRRVFKIIDEAREEQKKEFSKLKNEISKTRRMIANVTSSIQKCETILRPTTTPYNNWWDYYTTVAGK